MKLFYRNIGTGEPIVVLHGLYGSSDNWLTVGKALAENNRVILLDQRNHGQSPHSANHNYALMADDLHTFLASESIINPIIVGHSMGGKVAMRYTLEHPDTVKGLIVVDISPEEYTERKQSAASHLEEHRRIITAMQALPLGQLDARNDADTLLSEAIPQARIRQFLLKNLKRNKDGAFYWGLNLDAIQQNLFTLMEGINSKGYTYNGPVLFVKGGESDYITDDSRNRIENIFPSAQIRTIENAGHWVHAEQTDKFLELVQSFLMRI
ncbi:MAG: alpha/beta fold hydrolase [Bacteroidales bacterium]|nr:alpha/beta fold hydrolase [Bacteroidales bacterium]MBN2750481.1 alpha/beta fold hydrolase [Bacteroidales bacterium]